uniref:Uncharacterized protein n=1 Tax=Arundo donax TaxID=35708 RepID=A0A0A9FVN0_ARUDO
MSTPSLQGWTAILYGTSSSVPFLNTRKSAPPIPHQISTPKPRTTLDRRRIWVTDRSPARWRAPGPLPRRRRVRPLPPRACSARRSGPPRRCSRARPSGEGATGQRRMRRRRRHRRRRRRA